ncbi:MAG TPA: glycosyltransferase [Trebonia sp.]
MSTTAPQARHTVTAIIVAHDGARLLPDLVRALAAQTYPVEQTVGVDTASRDRSGAVLAELIGQDKVFGMHRSTGYGDAVAVALRHATRRRSGMTDPNLARVEWIWLLHDDCEPAPDALERLLWAAAKDRSVAVVGPKVLDGYDRRTLREVGVSIDRAGRRVTGIDTGEIDQGQHDHKRDVLAVGSAGMLVRRDVWDRLGGFDSHLKLFRDDVDFCWRVQAAGYRVQVVTDAVLYHRELSGRLRRPVEGGEARRLDRRSALFVLAVNLPPLAMLWTVTGCVAGSLARAFYFLLTKQLELASAYALSVVSLFGHPVKLVQGRRRRARGHAAGYNAVRMFIPPARTLFRVAERVAGIVSNGPPQLSGGRHQATEESEEDEQFTDTQSVMRRIIGHPGVQLFAVLLVVALIAERRLLGTSPLGGGALVPAWGGASALWQEYLAGFHAVSVGSTASVPPYLAVVAGLATVLGGQAWLAVDVLLLGCVPLAGLTAYLASRWLVTAAPARVLLAAAYALLPVATGAVAAGRIGTAVAFILLPLIGVSAGRMLTAAPRQARRAAWATGLLIALAAAFAPLTWILGVLLAAGALAARRWLVAADPVNAAIVVVTPFFVLFPWSLHLLTSPSAFLSEAGLSAQGLTTRGLSPAALFALSPGGPGLPPAWATAGFALALVALLFSGVAVPRVPPDGSAGGGLRRPAGGPGLLLAGWSVAVAGLLAGTVVSRISVTPAGGGQRADAWPGVALALAALGLLIASAPAAQRLAQLVTDGGPSRAGAAPGTARRLAAFAALAAAATAPLFVAAYWVKDGVHGPVSGITAPVLPAFVSASSTSAEQYRTLILRPDSTGSGLTYTVVRQGDPTLGEPELGTASAAGAALSSEVAALAAPDGADAGDPGMVLGQFGIRYVLLPGPVSSVLAQRLDAAIGLVALSKAPTYDLWQVAGPVARVRVVAADGTVAAVSSNAVSVSGAAAPAAGGTLILAEPYGGWTAKLNGQPLKPIATAVDGWAQGFVLPAGGGTLSVTRNNLAREFSLAVELIALLAVCLLALPGKRADPVKEAEALAALREARNGKRAAASPRRALRPARPAGAGAGRRAVGASLPGLARRRRAPQEPASGTMQDTGLTSAAGVALADPDDRELPERELSEQESPERVSAARVSPDWGPGWQTPDLERSGRHSQPDVDQYDWPHAEPEPADDSATYGDGLASPPGAPEPGDVSDADYWSVVGGTAPQAILIEPGDDADTADPTADPWAEEPQDTETASEPSTAEPRFTQAWDMAGEWGSAPAGALGAWASAPPAEPAPEPGPLDPGWRIEPQPTSPFSSPQPVFRLTSEQPLAAAQVPEAPHVPEAPQRQSNVPEFSELDFAPRGTEPQLPPWESGPQPSVSSTGTQPRLPWESGPQPPVLGTDAQPRLPGEGGPQLPVSGTDAQPRYPWESGSQAPVAATGGHPVSSTGSLPAERAPWETGEWDGREFAGAGGQSSSGSSDGERSQAEPESGSGSWPASPRPERQERHSHRAAKHGKPSRWRGSGNRSGGDGQS